MRKYSKYQTFFTELYDKDALVIIATYKAASQVMDSRVVPISFGGTYWYYFFNSQFLHAKGPLTEPAIVYVSNCFV